MKELETIQQFFEGLIDFFFDPCRGDEEQQEVIKIIQNSIMNKRLGRQLLPENPMDSLCSNGWNYKDYANSIKEAIENWEAKADIREGQFLS